MIQLRWIATVLVLIASPAWAQSDWPSRAVTVVLPFPAGGSIDTVTRAVTRELSAKFGQPFIVENRAGAAGGLGATAVSKAEPNGYTLLLATTSPLVINRYLYKLAYDPETAFTPIVHVANTPLIIVGSKTVPAANLKEFVAYSKANPGKMNAGSPGLGSQGHITVENLNKVVGASITHVPYRDYPQMLPDLTSGQLHMGLIFMPFFVPQVIEGSIVGLAVASHERSKSVPNVPTVAEMGYPELTAPGWFGLAAPAGTAPEIVGKINAVVNDYLKSEAGSSLLAKLSMTPGGGTPADFSELVRQEHRRWQPIIDKAGVRLQ